MTRLQAEMFVKGADLALLQYWKWLPELSGLRGRANRQASPTHTGEAPRPERPVSEANKSGQQARAARGRSEQERV